MRIGIIGIGRFGMQLAHQLSDNGVDLLVVDRDENAIDKIKDKAAQSFVLHSIDVKALRSIGIDELDTVIVAIGSDFSMTIQLTYILKKDFEIPNVIVRSTTGLKRDILEHAGADQVILPEYEAAVKLADDLSSPFPQLTRIKGEYCMGHIVAPDEFTDKMLREINLLEHHNVICIGIKRNSVMQIPHPDTIIQEGDMLYLAGKDADLDEFTKIK